MDGRSASARLRPASLAGAEGGDRAIGDDFMSGRTRALAKYKHAQKSSLLSDSKFPVISPISREFGHGQSAVRALSRMTFETGYPRFGPHSWVVSNKTEAAAEQGEKIPC